jgi:excisionase family DNA binding protein
VVVSEPRERLLTIREVAAQLQVSERTVRRWIAGEKLPCLRLRRLVRVDPGDLFRWLSARKE